METDVPVVTDPASWPAFVIGAAIALLIWGMVYGRQLLKKRRCKHLHPELIETGITLWECADCGKRSIDTPATMDPEGPSRTR